MSNKLNTPYIYFVASVATLGGLIMGYDSGVISGAIGFLETHFELNSVLKGFVVSSVVIGAMAGVLCAGYFSDRVGRKKVLFSCGFLLTLGALGGAVTNNLPQLIVCRILCGFGGAAAAMLPSLYISEIAPAQIRGRLISINQFAIVFGILAAYFVNSQIAGAGDDQWSTSFGWRWMFVSDAVVPISLVFLILTIPETPRWLAKHGNEEKALAILSRVGGQEYAQTELNEINKSLGEDGAAASVTDLFQPGLRMALLIGIGLGILAHATGINLVVYYAPEILKSTGIDTTKAMNDTVIVGVIMFLFTLIAFFYVDKLGRKPLLLIASAGMGVSLLLLGSAFLLDIKGGPWVLLSMLAYVAFFAVAMGPVVWVVIPEIFPTHIRGRAVSIAALASWTALFTISQLFPVMLERLKGFTFFFYAGMCAVSFFFILLLVPETKGKSLEEIEQMWKRSSG